MKIYESGTPASDSRPAAEPYQPDHGKLSEQLKVSKETIRRDLNELQTQGKILRNHGRAKYIHRQNQDSGDPFHIRLKSHYAHKADIAREALAWIEEGDGDSLRRQFNLLVSGTPVA